jgi:DNA-binding NarL/FixJ family response regulator
MTLEQAVEEAAAGLQRYEERPGDRPEAGDELLTERERAVLRLLSEGRSNREIGEALFISQSTAGVHVSNILRKLGVRGRLQAAARAQELGLLQLGPTERLPRMPAPHRD